MPEPSQWLRARPGSAVMTGVVSEGAGRRTRALCAELALKTLQEEQDPRQRLRAVVEQVLVFTDTTYVAVFVPGDTGAELRLIESAGVPRSLYGLRDSYPLAGASPLAS